MTTLPYPFAAHAGLLRARENQRLPSHQSAESRMLDACFRRRLRTHTLASQATKIVQRPAPTNATTGTSSIVGPEVHTLAAPSNAASTTIPITSLMANCALSPTAYQGAKVDSCRRADLYVLSQGRALRSRATFQLPLVHGNCAIAPTGCPMTLRPSGMRMDAVGRLCATHAACLPREALPE